MVCFIGLDDTDNLESRGTGRLARMIAGQLMNEFNVLGVVRHQLLFDRRVPYTSHNSSAAIILQSESFDDLDEIFRRVKGWMQADFQPGSDPGLCIATIVPEAVVHFGLKAKRELVSQQEARSVAASSGILLEGLGGTEDGVIGALAAVGLAACGEDGRYVMAGRLRELSGLQPLETVLSAGVEFAQTLDGGEVTQGLVMTDKLRPARRGSRPVAFLEWNDGFWQPVRLD